MGPALVPRKLTVFVAANPAALARAQELTRTFETAYPHISAERGWPDTATPSGPGMLAHLIDAARHCDIAFILHDAQAGGSRGPHGALFEAGVCLGRLGLAPNRVVVLTSLASTLPRYMDGLRVMPLDTRVEELVRLVDAEGALRQPEPDLIRIRADELMWYERHRAKGGRLRDQQEVCVVASKPLELLHPYAATVRDNLNHGIRYNYFFQARPDDVGMVAELFKALVEVGLPTDATTADFARSAARLTSGFRVHLLPQEPPLEFCVHNANDRDDATCFVQRHRDAFFCWYRGAAARQVGRDLLKQTRPSVWGARHIVHGTRAYNEKRRNARQLRAYLVDEIYQRVGARLQPDQIAGYCFGTSH